MFQLSDAWKATYPNAHAGVLVMRGVKNPPHHAGLEERKAALEAELRARYANQYRGTTLTHLMISAPSNSATGYWTLTLND